MASMNWERVKKENLLKQRKKEYLDDPRNAKKYKYRKKLPNEREAIEYLRNYRGTFPFLLDLKEKTKHNLYTLSEKQIEAITNCRKAQAEWR